MGIIWAHRRSPAQRLLSVVLPLVLASLTINATGAENKPQHFSALGGLALQANESGALPSEETLRAFLGHGQTVRDVLGWQRVEPARGQFVMPDVNWRLYTLVASVGGKNVVTLFSGNRNYGMEKFGF